jgi:DNA-binding FrmR family transcriptional regulator
MENNSTPTTTTPQDPVVTQLNRIQGQIAGIAKMYCDDRSCTDVVHQILAARSSLGKVARELLTTEASRCSKERKFEDFDQVLKELLR